jgi:hypothetical protein
LRAVLVASFVLCAVSAPRAAPQDPAQLAKAYVGAVEKLNEAHAKNPGDDDEAKLASKLPKDAVKALDTLLSIKDKRIDALVACGEAALAIDRVADFDRICASLGPKDSKPLGIVLSKPRYQIRGFDGMEKEGLEALSGVLDEVLAAYDELFGFAELSKVPGKKLRVRAHLVPKIEKPPHFAPQFPYHSEIDFPLIDPKAFSSPTKEGQFQFYGLCHELGHVIAMWGDRSNEEDKHTWAHYTGVTIVEHLAASRKDAPALRDAKDVRWRSLEIERKKIAEAGTKPGSGDARECLALFIALHDLVGPKTIGEAINTLDGEDKRLRINRVRYYGFDAFEKALLATDAGKKKAKELQALFH